MLSKKIGECCTRQVISVSSDAPVSEAIELMYSNMVTSVLIIEARRPVGIVTARDLPDIYNEHTYDPEEPVFMLMTSPLQTCRESDSLLDALDMMINYEFRHIPIVGENGMLVGIISETDIMNSLGFFDPMRHQTVAGIMDRAVLTLTCEQTLAAAMKLFKTRRNDFIVVTDGASAAGIITERDIPRLISSGTSLDTPVSLFMSQPIIGVETDTPVQDAIKLMHRDNIHHLVVLNASGGAEGVISRASFLQDMSRYLIRELVKSERMIEELQSKIESGIDPHSFSMRA